MDQDTCLGPAAPAHGELDGDLDAVLAGRHGILLTPQTTRIGLPPSMRILGLCMGL
jgi:hypothetical protein